MLKYCFFLFISIFHFSFAQSFEEFLETSLEGYDVGASKVSLLPSEPLSLKKMRDGFEVKLSQVFKEQGVVILDDNLPDTFEGRKVITPDYYIKTSYLLNEDYFLFTLDVVSQKEQVVVHSTSYEGKSRDVSQWALEPEYDFDELKALIKKNREAFQKAQKQAQDYILKEQSKRVFAEQKKIADQLAQKKVVNPYQGGNFSAIDIRATANDKVYRHTCPIPEDESDYDFTSRCWVDMRNVSGRSDGDNRFYVGPERVIQGADVYLNGEWIGKTPLIEYELESGEYELEVVPSDIFIIPKKEKITVGRGYQKLALELEMYRFYLHVDSYYYMGSFNVSFGERMYEFVWNSRYGAVNKNVLSVPYSKQVYFSVYSSKGDLENIKVNLGERRVYLRLKKEDYDAAFQEEIKRRRYKFGYWLGGILGFLLIL